MTHLYAKLQTRLHTNLEALLQQRRRHPDAGDAIGWAIVTAAGITIAITIAAAVTAVAKRYTGLVK